MKLNYKHEDLECFGERELINHILELQETIKKTQEKDTIKIKEIYQEEK
jgi:hypothetical protein